MIEKLFGGLSMATPESTRSLRSQRCDFADLVQPGTTRSLCSQRRTGSALARHRKMLWGMSSVLGTWMQRCVEGSAALEYSVADVQ